MYSFVNHKIFERLELPKETVGRMKAVLVERLFNDEKEYNDKQDDDKKRWQQKNMTMYINL